MIYLSDKDKNVFRNKKLFLEKIKNYFKRKPQTLTAWGIETD